ncbi:MAG: metal ABC transporter permease, partial [Nitrospinae bacterium]|nr:metal ABC transporter permease [Nitrospinota bacterium]
LVIPGATGYTLARQYRGMMAISIASALLAVTAGLVISYYLDIASGAAIVLSSAALFLFASLAGRVRRA